MECRENIYNLYLGIKAWGKNKWENPPEWFLGGMGSPVRPSGENAPVGGGAKFQDFKKELTDTGFLFFL